MRMTSVDKIGDFLAGEGLDASSGVLKVTPISDIASSASKGSILREGSDGALVSASLSQDMVSGSLQVYLNGLLQTPSGSVQGGSTHVALYDYKLITDGTYNGKPAAVFVAAIDNDDVVQLRYLKK